MAAGGNMGNSTRRRRIFIDAESCSVFLFHRPRTASGLERRNSTIPKRAFFCGERFICMTSRNTEKQKPLRTAALALRPVEIDAKDDRREVRRGASRTKVEVPRTGPNKDGEN